MDIIQTITRELHLRPEQTENTVRLLEEQRNKVCAALTEQEVLKVGDIATVWVLKTGPAQKRISLTMKPPKTDA